MTIFLNLYHAPFYVSKMRYMIRHRDTIPLEKRYRTLQAILAVFARPVLIKTISTGQENLPKGRGGYVMFPNHQGKYDVVGIVLTNNDPASFVMDKARSHFIMISETLDILGGKRLDLNDIRQNLTVINEMAEEVKNGTNYIIFSEGPYEKHNGNRVVDFKPGSFKCATKVKAPIVPVCLIDSYKPFNSNIHGPVTTQVHYLDPIYYEEYKDMKVQEIASLVRSRIVDKMRSCGVEPE